MYGGLGFAGQWSGLKISTDDVNREENATTHSRAKTLGLFHVVYRLNIRGCYFFEGIVCLITGYHGLKLLMCSESDTFEQIRRHKFLWILLLSCR
jgi:hypothetical protein